MHLAQRAALVVALAAGVVRAQSQAYAQCGGTGWAGATTCVSGYTCTESNQYYSQCLPGTAAASTSSVAAATSTSVPPAASSATSSTVASGTGTGTATSVPSASTTLPGASTNTGPGTTLQSGYYWIRAVESPNFHKYLQTDPQYTTGTAVMDDYTTAGQFNIVDGQLVELVNSDVASPTLLYLNVATSASASDPATSVLATSFETTENTYGTFVFSGDAVTWSASNVTRQNTAAWYMCADQQLYINLGAYDYLTPTGCADETIHYYNGATAVD